MCAGALEDLNNTIGLSTGERRGFLLNEGEKLRRIVSSLVIASLFLSLFAFVFTLQTARIAEVMVYANFWTNLGTRIRAKKY
jgi:hypothetical protein